MSQPLATAKVGITDDCNSDAQKRLKWLTRPHILAPRSTDVHRFGAFKGSREPLTRRATSLAHRLGRAVRMGAPALRRPDDPETEHET